MGQNARMQQVGETEVMGKWSPVGGGQENKGVRLPSGGRTGGG